MLFVVWRVAPCRFSLLPSSAVGPTNMCSRFFLLFYFACFIKIVVHWDKSQPQTVGCLAAECNSLAPFWEDLTAGNEGLQRLRPTKYMASLEKWPSTGRGAEWGAVEEAAGFIYYSEPLEMHQCTRHCGVSRGCRRPQAAVIADLCFSISQPLG